MTDGSHPAQLPFLRERPRNHQGVRVLVTGQVGLEKKPFLEQVAALARANGHDVLLFHVGEMMLAEAPDIVRRRILDLPRQRLNALRRSAFKDILLAASTDANIIVSTHATFRWKHGLFHAFDHNQVTDLDPDLFVTLVDNLHAVHERLEREHEIYHSLKDILVWREEEIVVTEAMAEAIAGYGANIVLSRGDTQIAARSLYRLMFESQRKRVYPSFPMTYVLDEPKIMGEIERFRDTLAEHFITFDPGDVDEKGLLHQAGEATRRGENVVTITVNERPITIAAGEITRVARDIDAQIYARDFKLIEQSDMIVSYIPARPDGRPVLSSGVERELQHAFESTKEVYVLWRPHSAPSPFVSETATAIFRSMPEMFAHFQQRGYVNDFQLPLS